MKADNGKQCNNLIPLSIPVILAEFVSWLGMAVSVQTYAVTGILCGQARRNASDRVLSSKEMKVLQQSLELVKMDNTPIPFPHPILLSRTGVLE